MAASREWLWRIMAHIPEGTDTRQAAEEQLKSWDATLARSGPSRVFGAPLQDTNKGFFLETSDPSKIVLINLLEENRLVHVEPPPSMTKSSQKTIAKKELTAKSPLDKYLGRLNLYSGKFDSIQLSPSPSPS